MLRLLQGMAQQELRESDWAGCILSAKAEWPYSLEQSEALLVWRADCTSKHLTQMRQ